MNINDALVERLEAERDNLDPEQRDQLQRAIDLHKSGEVHDGHLRHFAVSLGIGDWPPNEAEGYDSRP